MILIVLFCSSWCRIGNWAAFNSCVHVRVAWGSWERTGESSWHGDFLGRCCPVLWSWSEVTPAFYTNAYSPASDLPSRLPHRPSVVSSSRSGRTIRFSSPPENTATSQCKRCVGKLSYEVLSDFTGGPQGPVILTVLSSSARYTQEIDGPHEAHQVCARCPGQLADRLDLSWACCWPQSWHDGVLFLSTTAKPTVDLCTREKRETWSPPLPIRVLYRKFFFLNEKIKPWKWLLLLLAARKCEIPAFIVTNNALMVRGGWTMSTHSHGDKVPQYSPFLWACLLRRWVAGGSFPFVCGRWALLVEADD